MTQSARDLVAAILNDKAIVNTLANVCVGQYTEARAQHYCSSEEEVRSLFNRGRPGPPTVSQAANQVNLSMLSTSQECPPAAPVYKLRPYTRKGRGYKR